MLTAQVGPLRFVGGSRHYNARFFGCHYYFTRRAVVAAVRRFRGCRSFEVPLDLRTYPLTNRNRHAVADHSIRIISASGERECVRHALQTRILSNCLRSYSARESRIRNESCAQVFGVVRHAGWCDIAPFWIADYRFIAILAGETSVHILRNVCSWLRL